MKALPMSRKHGSDSMNVKLSGQRREQLISELIGLFQNQFDQELSSYQAEIVVNHFMKRMEPAVYNQAVQDALAFMRDKLQDLDIEVYAPEQD